MNKGKTNTFIFYIFFALYFLSLFICDVSFPEKLIGIGSRMLKLCSFSVMIIYLFMNFSKIKKLESTIIVLFAIILFIASHDIIWIAVAFLSICSKTQTNETIFKSSFRLLLILTGLTLFYCLLGVVPDIINIRSNANTVVRHSLGFYHSNVLPIILFYLTVYYCIIKENETNMAVLLFIFLLDVLFLFLCNSRSAFLCTILILIISVFTKIKLKTKVLDGPIRFISKNILLLFFFISYILTYFRAKTMYMSIITVLDKFLNNRIYLSALKYNIFGIKFINFMDSETYFSIKHTIDNGYIYTLLRYGILVAIIYILINLSFISIYKNKKSIQLIFIVVALANFVDNDLFSYGFLPFLVIGINNISVLVEGQVKKYERKHGVINHSNI